MKIKGLILTSLFLFIQFWTARADEGMWLLSLIAKYNIAQMQKMGLKLSAEDIYSVNHASLKDAVVALDYGSCTAELVSDQGLLFTNHHCGYDEIQAHSSLEHNYLKNGFWAPSLKDELPNPGKTATFLIRMEDVTSQVLEGVTKYITEEQRQSLIDANIELIKTKAVKGTKYEARVESFFDGNQYFLFVLQTFKDIRLVGAPPESIGKFGHDTDNWMYPRHTGDFSIFRIYCAPDGSPAQYSPDNVPLNPKKFLPISLKGYKKGDFAMILGYPGSTQRYIPSYAIQNIHDIVNPIRVGVRTIKQDIMKQHMDAAPAVKIKYSAKYAQSSNYWKYSIGENKGIEQLHLIEQKQAFENKLQNWISNNLPINDQYANLLSDLQNAYLRNRKAEQLNSYFDEAIFGGADIIMFAYYSVDVFSEMLNKSPRDTIKARIAKLRERAENFFKNFDAATDKEILNAMLKVYRQNVTEPELQASIIHDIDSLYGGDLQKYTNYLYANTIMADQEKFNKFLKKPKAKTLEKDPGFQLMLSFLNNYRLVYMATQSLQTKIDSTQRLFTMLSMQMQSGKNFYPDANSTMRLTYGKVQNLEPKDGVIYKYYTTLKGVMQKEDPDNPEFIVPQKLKQLYNNKDFGRYADPDGSMHLCFITDNDITGGNSGSPVINANGELIGIAFDGNWEAMSSDLQYIPKLQRTIIVDIRYVLFIIDKFAGAQRLIQECKLE